MAVTADAYCQIFKDIPLITRENFKFLYPPQTCTHGQRQVRTQGQRTNRECDGLTGSCVRVGAWGGERCFGWKINFNFSIVFVSLLSVYISKMSMN